MCDEILRVVTNFYTKRDRPALRTFINPLSARVLVTYPGRRIENTNTELPSHKNDESCIDLTVTADESFVDLTEASVGDEELPETNAQGANDNSVVIIDTPDARPRNARKSDTAGMRKGSIRTYGRHRNRVIVSDAWLSESDRKENIFGTSSENDSSEQSSPFHISSSSSENSLSTGGFLDKSSEEENSKRTTRNTRNNSRNLSKNGKENKPKAVNKTTSSQKKLLGTTAKRKRTVKKTDTRPTAKDLSVNFSDFDDYSLTIQDASSHQKKEVCMETSTPVAKRTRKIIPIKNTDISHIEMVVSPCSDTYYPTSETSCSVHYKSEYLNDTDETSCPSLAGTRISERLRNKSSKDHLGKDCTKTPESVVLLTKLTESFIDRHVSGGDKKAGKHSKNGLEEEESMFRTPNHARNDMDASEDLFSTPHDAIQNNLKLIRSHLKQLSFIEHSEEGESVDEGIDGEVSEEEEGIHDVEEESEEESNVDELSALLETEEPDSETDDLEVDETSSSRYVLNEDDDADEEVNKECKHDDGERSDEDVGELSAILGTEEGSSESHEQDVEETNCTRYALNEDDDDDKREIEVRVTRQTKNTQLVLNQSVGEELVESASDEEDDKHEIDEEVSEDDDEMEETKEDETDSEDVDAAEMAEDASDEDDDKHEIDEDVSEDDDEIEETKEEETDTEDVDVAEMEEEENDSEEVDVHEEDENESAEEVDDDKTNNKDNYDSTPSRRYSFQNASLKNSFSEMLTPTKVKGSLVPVPASTKVMVLCGQTEPISFTKALTRPVLAKCVKIGEGVYGEVFRSTSNNQSVAIKVIPIEGDFLVNDEPQKKFDEILPEIVIAKELSDLRLSKKHLTSTYCEVNSVSCVRGKYPNNLLKQWDEYDKAKRSENDRPDVFKTNQLFIVFEFADCGTPLDNYKFDTLLKAKSVLTQVTFALAAAEEAFQFEHRDLHWGNVLVRETEQEEIAFMLHGHKYPVPTMGVEASIIDYTMSRLTKDGCKVYSDLSKDDTLFQGKGDYQFDIYRNMKEANGNNWAKFCPYTNVLWLHYLADKLVYKNASSLQSRDERDILRQFRQFMSKMLDYSSASQMAIDALFLNS